MIDLLVWVVEELRKFIVQNTSSSMYECVVEDFDNDHCLVCMPLELFIELKASRKLAGGEVTS